MTNYFNLSAPKLSEVNLLDYKTFPERHFRSITIRSWSNAMETEDEGGNWKHGDNKTRRNKYNSLDEGNQDWKCI